MFFLRICHLRREDMKRIVAALAIALFVGAGLYVGGAIVYSPTAAADPN